MARVARRIDPAKIEQLQNRIQDPRYVDAAVDRLAGGMTDRILGLDETVPADLDYRSASSSKNDIAVLLRPPE